MHAISSYCGNRHPKSQDQLQYTAPQLARSEKSHHSGLLVAQFAVYNCAARAFLSSEQPPITPTSAQKTHQICTNLVSGSSRGWDVRTPGHPRQRRSRILCWLLLPELHYVTLTTTVFAVTLCPSVCPSVMLRYCIYTAKDIVKLLSRPGSLITRFSDPPPPDTQFQMEPLQLGHKIHGDEKFVIFYWNRHLSQKRKNHKFFHPFIFCAPVMGVPLELNWVLGQGVKKL